MKKLKRNTLQWFCIYSLLGIASFNLTAQPLSQFFPAFEVNGALLPLASVGGLSAPQYSEVDLNRDGILDLFIYDKIGQVGMTFLNGGTPFMVDYAYAPEYLSNFPTLTEWVLLRDYNGDGIQDIFAYSSIPGVSGMEVYTGYYDEENRITFQQFQFTQGAHNIIYYPSGNGFSNLFISNIDYPSVDDIDGDGDLDIVTFNLGGGIVELYTNQSVERGFGLDSLQFVLEDDCWGRFYESGITEEIDLATSPEECAIGFISSTPRNGQLHAGSTVLTIDMDNDGDKEVMLGDISFSNINLLTNGGNNESAYMIAQDIAFPSNSTSVQIPLFPAAFHLDINNDGLKDIVAAPNLSNDVGETLKVGWWYANINTNENPVFDFRYDDLLVRDMLDFGTGAFPTFVDYNADGLQDIVVGNNSFFVPGGDKNARLYLFENIGSLTNPAFVLVDDDYLSLNAFSNSSRRFTPTFGDLDSDGDLDVLVGEAFGNLFYAENIAGPNQPFEFSAVRFGYQDIDVGQTSSPQIVDVNKDGLVDLVIGERNGNINYYENQGTPTDPQFDTSPTNNRFGDIDVRGEGAVIGHSAPVLIEIDGELALFSGSIGGDIRRYTNIEDNLAGVFPEVESNYGQLNTGGENYLDFADINQDGLLEMVVGNIRGGIQFYATDLQSTSTPTIDLEEENYAVELYPSPATNHLYIKSSTLIDGESIEVHDVLGRSVMKTNFSNSIAIPHLGAGIYFLTIRSQKAQITKKFVKGK